MANKKRGYYTLQLGGKNRTLHFSMNFWANFTEGLNIPLDKIGEVFNDGLSIADIRLLIYRALLAYDQENGNDIEYNEFSVGAWLEEVTAENINEMIEALTQTRILGNDLNMGIKRNVTQSTRKQKKTIP